LVVVVVVVVVRANLSGLEFGIGFLRFSLHLLRPDLAPFPRIRFFWGENLIVFIN
jgi:hypothetical protein